MPYFRTDLSKLLAIGRKSTIIILSLAHTHASNRMVIVSDSFHHCVRTVHLPRSNSNRSYWPVHRHTAVKFSQRLISSTDGCALYTYWTKSPTQNVNPFNNFLHSFNLLIIHFMHTHTTVQLDYGQFSNNNKSKKQKKEKKTKIIISIYSCHAMASLFLHHRRHHSRSCTIFVYCCCFCSLLSLTSSSSPPLLLSYICVLFFFAFIWWWYYCSFEINLESIFSLSVIFFFLAFSRFFFFGWICVCSADER